VIGRGGDAPPLFCGDALGDTIGDAHGDTVSPSGIPILTFSCQRRGEHGGTKPGRFQVRLIEVSSSSMPTPARKNLPRCEGLESFADCDATILIC
jgi:hypothetical protein